MSAIVDKFSATIAVCIDFIGGVTFERFGAKALLEAGRGVADPNKRDVLAVVPVVRGSLQRDVAKLTRAPARCSGRKHRN
jgi:hypothetical protein